MRQHLLCRNTACHTLVLGGEPLPSPKVLLSSWPEDSGTRLFNIYGTTECSCWAFLHQVHRENILEEYNDKEIDIHDFEYIPVDDSPSSNFIVDGLAHHNYNGDTTKEKTIAGATCFPNIPSHCSGEMRHPGKVRGPCLGAPLRGKLKSFAYLEKINKERAHYKQ